MYSRERKAIVTARWCVSLVLAGWSLGAVAGSSALDAPVDAASFGGYGASAPTVAENFRLTDHLGRSHELERLSDVRAIVLFSVYNGCPIVQQSYPRMNALSREYEARGVRFFMVNSNPYDDRASVVKEAKEFEVESPILLDPVQVVARSLGLRRTGEVLVVLPESYAIAYRGPIDDRFDYGARRPRAEHEYLRDALEAVLAGEPVREAVVKAKGCIIDLEPMPERVSYARDVAPIVRKRCVSCHSRGNIGPFAFDSHRRVAARRGMIREVLMTKRMPPWHADPQYGTFSNDDSLTANELRTVLAWLDRGAPRGEGPDPLKAHAARLAAKGQEWPLGEPDKVIVLSRHDLPAEGVFDYRYERVEVGLEEDVWVRAADVLPGNRRALHHVLVFLKYPEHLAHLQPSRLGGLDGFFAGYAPGKETGRYPEGTGRWVPKGSTLIFQVHYTATGKPESDVTRLGLYFHEPGVEPREFYSKAAVETAFVISPGDAESKVSAVYEFEKAADLLVMIPHMHFRGKYFSFEAEYPDGSRKTLLSVPNYDFNWQRAYRLAEPEHLPAGTRLVCRGAFDNSPGNPQNPDATKTVYFGEQSWDEMFIGYLGFTRSEGDALAARAE